MTSERIEVQRTIAADPAAILTVTIWSSIDPAWKQAGVFPVISEGAPRATLGILARTIARGRS